MILMMLALDGTASCLPRSIVLMEVLTAKRLGLTAAVLVMEVFDGKTSCLPEASKWMWALAASTKTMLLS